MRYFISNRDQRDITPEEMLSDAHGNTASRLELPIEGKNFIIFGILLAIGLVTVLVRVFWLTVINYDAYAKHAEQNRIRIRPLPAQRGLIYDRWGTPLLENSPIADIIAIPSELPRDAAERTALASGLAEMLSLDAEGSRVLDAMIRATSTAPTVCADAISGRQAVVFEARGSEFPGMVLRLTPSRSYLNGPALYHIVGSVGRAADDDIAHGYLSSDFVGKTGLEARYESLLRGTHGSDRIEVDARNAPVRTLSHSEPIPGEHLVLALDGALQNAAYEGLQRTVQRLHAPGGAVVAVDPRDGSVLALASYPSVDANLLGKRISPEEYRALLSDERHPFFNRAIAARYPSGSTIKPFMAAAALAEKIVTPSTVINDTGAISITDIYNPSVIYTFHGYATLGPVNLASAIALSSDIYFYTVGGGFGRIEGLGIDRINMHLAKFGFGNKLGIDLPGENEGLIPSPAYKEKAVGEPWRIGDTYNTSIGQGYMGVTPLQLAAATAAIANGGTLWQPRLATRTVDGDFRTVREFQPNVIRTDLNDAENITAVRNGMRLTVTGGTAKLLQQLPVAAAAKTGTAQTGKSSKYHALVTAFAPYEKPEIAIAVIVEKSGEGGDVAVPLAREILAEYFKERKE